jgi:8-oxo-dGTP diphosphatase
MGGSQFVTRSNIEAAEGYAHARIVGQLIDAEVLMTRTRPIRSQRPTGGAIGGRACPRCSAMLALADCRRAFAKTLRREIKEELPKLKLGRIRLWKKVNGTNRHSSLAMSDAIFIVNAVSGDLTIGGQHEVDKAVLRALPRAFLTPGEHP